MLATAANVAWLTTACFGMGYVLVCGVIAHRFTTTHRKTPVAPSADVHTVTFVSRDRRTRIAAWYQRPAQCRGAVVLVHGKDACRGDELKSDGAVLAAALSAAGLALLRIDLRGHGTSAAARLTYGHNERLDVLSAVDWLQAQGHQRIGLLGASMGAASVLLAAADAPAVMAVVADSAFADFGTMIERQYGKQCRLPRCFLPGALAIGRLLTGVALRGVSPLRAAAALQGRPVLVIHSEGDRFIPVADGRAIAAACRAALWTTDTPGHVGAYRADPDGYAARVMAFFEQHMLGAGPARETPTERPAWRPTSPPSVHPNRQPSAARLSPVRARPKAASAAAAMQARSAPRYSRAGIESMR